MIATLWYQRSRWVWQLYQQVERSTLHMGYDQCQYWSHFPRFPFAIIALQCRIVAILLFLRSMNDYNSILQREVLQLKMNPVLSDLAKSLSQNSRPGDPATTVRLCSTCNNVMWWADLGCDIVTINQVLVLWLTRGNKTVPRNWVMVDFG